MKNVTILGSTGSIGTQSLEVIEKFPKRFKVEALTCGRNIERMAQQIRRFEPSFVVTEREEDALALAHEFTSVEFGWGEEGLVAAARTDCDIVLNSLMGMRGLAPTCAAIEAGHDIALANKETLVAGGAYVMELAARKSIKLLPVDSEHSAIFQALEGNQNRPIKKILLTASGGPFRGYTREQLENVTLSQALKHPNWSMGRKITIDSASMMNKGLEVIEARWLFDVPARDIEVYVHPQSIVHSAVEFMDNSVIAQLGTPDMRIPISLALGYPDRLENPLPELNLFDIGALTFEKPDLEVFQPLALAYDAIEAGGTYPLALNAANEVAVDAFLSEKIRFLDIQKTLKIILDDHKPLYNLDLEGILAVDRDVRRQTERVINSL